MDRVIIASEAGLVDAVRAALADSRTVEICGHGTKRGLGRRGQADILLDLSGLSGIVDYDPEELILTARAATPVNEIEAAIAAHNQHLGFAPADWGPLFASPPADGTLGGAVATDCGGSARVRFGAARDHVLGFRAVNGFGEAYKAGGKVVKNVTGFDVAKLMCGGYGTLGPMSEITVKLLPRAPQSASFALRDLSPRQGLNLLRKAWAEPLEASGLLYVPASAYSAFPMVAGAGDGTAFVRLDGAPDALDEKRKRLQSLIEGHRSLETGAGEDVFGFAGNGGPFVNSALDVWRLSVPPSAAAQTAEALAGTLWYADWAGSLFWLGTTGDAAVIGRQLQHIADLAGGQMQALRLNTPGAAEALPVRSEGVRAMMGAVKQAFDPAGIFNPGRLYAWL